MPRKGPLTEEHKKKLQDGRILARKKREAGIPNRKKSKVFDKPVVQFTGYEQDAFDFIPLVRAAFRKQKNYISSPKIIHDITDKKFWQNPQWVINFLSQYCIMEKVDGVKKVRKKRAPLSEERKAALRENLKKAREARSKK